MNIAIIGSMWGDEGKGAITHYFSTHYDWVVRFSGGANAGHTIYRDSVKYVHNLLPSFDWRNPNAKCFLGSGMVVDLEQLCNEMEKLPLNIAKTPIVYVDPDAFAVLPKHKEEDKIANAYIGVTNRGIGPAYKEKVGRTGTRIRDLIKDNNEFAIRAKSLNVQFKTVLELYDTFIRGNILFEGAQGMLIDINHGTYPYVSCGDSSIAGIYASGFSFVKLDKVYGVSKAYCTRVGEGPFPTEFFGEEAEALRKLGNEYGATTGRPRRVGCVDLPALNYSCKKGGINSLIITKFDILNGCKTVKMCNNYEMPLVSAQDFFDVKPKYIEIPGWNDAHDLKQIKPFINMVEEVVKIPVSYISCGVNPQDIISVSS